MKVILYCTDYLKVVFLISNMVDANIIQKLLLLEINSIDIRIKYLNELLIKFLEE